MPAFPIHLAQIKTIGVGEKLASALGETVYKAQKDQHFSVIWEQRRTTAAVIMGFRNLDEAVGGMSKVLARSVRDLRNIIPTGNPATSTQQMEKVVELLNRQDACAGGWLVPGDNFF